jgi:hypothetical protein
MTSRWVVEVAPQRGVPVRWRAYSLGIKNEGVEIPEQYRPMLRTTRGALRVVEAVWAEHGDERIGRLYTELGTRFHLQGDLSLDAVAAALEAAGLDPSFASAADDERWDDQIRGSMAEATEQVGTDVGVPILVFRDGDVVAGIAGPVVSPAPTGEEALAVWDSVVALTFSPGFFELKRSRTTGPQVS